ncbi:hypothetical protein SK128_025601 [Halocaridina rubra]|uniref:Uncharacterized protein n=1 Tax=Halocaridina rubra TaxID=373956 RepID=A0AAN8WLT3_HALRR
MRTSLDPDTPRLPLRAGHNLIRVVRDILRGLDIDLPAQAAAPDLPPWCVLLPDVTLIPTSKDVYPPLQRQLALETFAVVSTSVPAAHHIYVDGSVQADGRAACAVFSPTMEPPVLADSWIGRRLPTSSSSTYSGFAMTVRRRDAERANRVSIQHHDHFLHSRYKYLRRGLMERYNADELKVAVHQARLALKLSLTARKKKYSFVARFKGKFGSVFKGKKQRTDEFTQQKLEAEKRHYRRIKTDFGLFDSQVSSDEGTINEDISAAITKKETQDEEISNPDNCKALESEGQGNIRMPSENKIAKYSENEDEALRENERDFCHVLGNQTDSLYHKEISTAVETCAKARKQKTATTLSIIDDKISQEVCIEGHGLGNPEKSSEIMETLENPPHDNTQDQLSSEDLPSLVDIRKNTTDMTKNFVDDTSKKRNDNKTTCMSDAGACSKEIRSNIMGGYEDESEGGDMEVHENKDKGICSTSGNTDKGICATSGNTDKGICAKAGMRTDRNKVEGTFRRDVALFPGTASTWHSCKDGRHCMISKPIKRELVKNVNSLDDVNKKNELFDEFPSTQGDLKENIAGIIKQLENETDKNDYGEGNVDCLGAEHISKGSKTVFVQKHDTRISQDDKLGRKIYTKSDLQSNILQQNEMEYVGTNDLSMVPDSQESVNSCEDFSKKHNLIPSHLNKASLGKSLIVDQESEEIQLQYNHLH